jgi:DNA-binding transcriptional ArsR family regulator
MNYSQQASLEAMATLFGSAARATVLKLFMVDPVRPCYQRQIEAATGLAIRAVQRELERLTSMGLLYRRAEGNRTYYQVDMHFPFFDELRGMVLKCVGHEDRLRGALTMNPLVRLAFLNEAAKCVLVVTPEGRLPGFTVPESFTLEEMTTDEFVKALAEQRTALGAFLSEGVDLLGRRDDVIWHRIEAAGYSVQKGKGVA